MKCKVCGNELQAGRLICPACGFDESRNYEDHPTGAPLKHPAQSVADRRKAYNRKHLTDSGGKIPHRKSPVPAFLSGVCVTAVIAGGLFWAVGSGTIPNFLDAPSAGSSAETSAPTETAESEPAENTVVRWDFDEDSGVLTISGSGSMDNCYDGEQWKWNKYQYRIKEVAIEGGITDIGYEAFWDCTSITSITVPDSVVSIGDGAFGHCDSLTDITIPDTITSIGGDTFAGCSNLTCITLPDSITSIEEDAFYGCNALTDITIPDSVASIGDYAFSDCDALTDITIPDSVASIGEDAFYGCDSLICVTISDSVAYIGDYAFHYCGQLSEVYYSGSESDWNSIDIGKGNYELTDADIRYNSRRQA